MPKSDLRSQQEHEKLTDALTDLCEHRICFNEHLGLKVVDLWASSVSIKFSMRPEFVGHYLYGRLHGGVTATVLDATGGLATMVAIANQHSAESADEIMQRFAFLGTVDMRVDYLRQGMGEHFVADAEIVRLGRRIAAARMNLYTVFHLSHPFGDSVGAERWNAGPMQQLFSAFPDLERRDFIVLAGRTSAGAAWVGCAGYFMGSFRAPLLGIPPTGRLAGFRYHEFYRIENNQLVEFQAVWDIPELMQQANAWPMGPALGVGGFTPAPARQDGLVVSQNDEAQSLASLAVVNDMLEHMGRHPKEPEAAMALESFWHPKFNWYGPAGIGAMRGIAGFRHDHQIPFLNAVPDRRGGYAGEAYFIADENYVGETAWPAMQMTFTGSGFLGIVPNNQAITMRSLDFWRVENGLIRENWVLVDLLHVWDQLGVDVLARMRERITWPDFPRYYQ